MTEKDHVYQPMRKALPVIDWQRQENMLGSGTPDINACAPNGNATWIETKLVKGNQITFQKFQPAWLTKRTLYKDRVFVVARKDDTFYVWGGRSLLRLLSMADSRQDGKIHVVDYRAAFANFEMDRPYDWGRMKSVLFEVPMEAYD